MDDKWTRHGVSDRGGYSAPNVGAGWNALVVEIEDFMFFGKALASENCWQIDVHGVKWRFVGPDVVSSRAIAITVQWPRAAVEILSGRVGG